MTKAVLYARVSTEDQAGDDKTSLSEQLLALRKYADANDYEIVDEIPEDISGRKRNTPGLDQIRDMAEAGEIGAVLVHKWNRLARTVARFEAFMAEMKMYRVDVVALDGQSNRTSQGRAMNRMMAVFSELQRDDLIATMQQGKLGRARAGKVVPGRYAPYGFIYDPSIGNYHVDDRHMNHIRRIFRMIGTEGMSMYAVKKTLEREGVKPPGSGRFWHANRIRGIIQNDVYRPHGYDELKHIVLPEVAATLDRAGLYGVQWYNRERWERNLDPGPDDKAIQ